MPNVKDLRLMAKALGIRNLGKLRKEELIHSIQLAEGHDDCYGRIPDCGQTDCLFRPDCLPEEGYAEPPL